MNILAIDTATKIEIAAASSENVFSDQTKAVNVSHSIMLFNNIDLALKEAKIELNDINVIGVGIGPGSFTGIRIAVATARMFSQVFDLPLVGIKTHLMYAASVNEKANAGENILIAFDAKKSRVFGALYKKGEDDLKPVAIIEPGDYTIEYLVNSIIPEKKTILIGDGCGKYYTEIKSQVKEHELLPYFMPSGKTICRLIKKVYLENPDNYSDLNNVLPFYARRTDAEIMKGKI
ncbi:MAG: tRNA (adenosine(37)-N6)-threonylcarbamoyltransferase complex dimerization subunit type 1 TsaB [Spirochaetes bacterium]|nr:tRNA (adenosine(37)-N6)-threonylcarbamoyltransferase complex dimerization subunit type 1 TsaB [Spirochaetota bacterium]